MKKIKIGNVKLKNNLFLSPMVDVTDLPYRVLCRRAGAGMAYTEMLYINSILHPNKKTINLMKTNIEDKPSGIQITGPRINDFKKVIPHLNKFDIVDINCGCPSIKIIDNGSGSYLLKTPKKIGSYIKVLKDAGYTTTAKIRLGYKKNNVMKIAKEIEKSGADALTLHSRMSYDSYKIPADWSWISKIKKNIGIPVIGNGDVDSGKKAADMLDIADGVMIARAAIGDPLIFSRILYYLRTKREQDLDFKLNIKKFLEYIDLAEDYEVIDFKRIKFLSGGFIRGFSGAAKKRNEFMKLNSIKEAREFLVRLLN